MAEAPELNGYNAQLLPNGGSGQPYTRGLPGRGGGIPSFYWAFAVLALCSVCLTLYFPGVPADLITLVTAAGALVGTDATDSLRGRRDVFSPRSLVSVLMVNGFYVAPLLHVITGAFPKYIVLPADMTLALTNLAVLNLISAILYFVATRINVSTSGSLSAAKEPLDSPDKLVAISHAAFLLGLFSLGVFLVTVFQAGGPAGWLSSQFNYREDLASSGALLSLSEPFPSLFMISALAKLRTSKLSRRELGAAVAILFALVVVATFVTSGMRGSRANLVWPVLSMLVFVHLGFFGLKKRWLASIALVVAVFAGVYDVYKKTGTDGISDLSAGSFSNSREYSDLDFGPTTLLLGDFSRTGIQAILLDRSLENDFSWGWGKTYLGGALQFVPGVDAATIIPTKSVVATDALYGEGAAVVRDSLTTRIYGVQGEAMLNFGPVGFIAVMLPFALLLKISDDRFRFAQASNQIGPIIIASYLTPALMLMFVSDLDNMIRYVTSKAMLPILTVPLAAYLLSRTRDSRRRKSARPVVHQ